MKTKQTFLLFLSAMILMTSASCKKKEIDPDLPLINGSGVFEMKKDGKSWVANQTALTMASTEDAGNNVYLVAIGGDMITNNDQDRESMVFWMAITEDRFKNPKGTYDVFAADSGEDLENRIVAIFTESEKANSAIYSVGSLPGSSGKITITDFEIGDGGKLPTGEAIGKVFKRLKGSFELHMHEVTFSGNNVGGKRISLTEGKFDVNYGLNFYE